MCLKRQSSEQWLTNGICSKCRRKKYCTKGCTKHERKVNKDKIALATKIMTGALLKGSGQQV